MKSHCLVLLGGLLLLVSSAAAGCAQSQRGTPPTVAAQRDQPLLAVYEDGREGSNCEAVIWSDGGMLFMFQSGPPEERGLRYTVLETESLDAIDEAVAAVRTQLPPRDRTFALDIGGSRTVVIWLGGDALPLRLEWSETYPPAYSGLVESLDEFAEFASAWARLRLLVATTVRRAESPSDFRVIRPGRDYWGRERAWSETHIVR